MRQSSVSVFILGFHLGIVSVKIMDRFNRVIRRNVFWHLRENGGRVEERYRHVLKHTLVLPWRETRLFPGGGKADVLDYHVHRRLNLAIEDNAGLAKPSYCLAARSNTVLERPIINRLKFTRRHHRHDTLVFEFVRQNTPLWKS